MSLQCDPQGVGNGLTTYPRVFGATPLDLWLRNGHPQGVPTLTDPARWVADPAFVALYQWVEDPARDPRFIATGRAATAAMTCGQILVRTATPCGSH